MKQFSADSGGQRQLSLTRNRSVSPVVKLCDPRGAATQLRKSKNRVIIRP